MKGMCPHKYVRRKLIYIFGVKRKEYINTNTNMYVESYLLFLVKKTFNWQELFKIVI